MDLYSWSILIAQPLLALGAFIFLPRSVLPLKRGWNNEDQKELTRGGVFLIFGALCLILFLTMMFWRERTPAQ